MSAQSQFKRKAGGLASHWLKIVCSRCNSGWMGGLQTRAQEWIDPIIDGEWPTIDETACRALAAWATMTTMVIETAHQPTQVTTQPEREKFMADREALQSWKVWIGLMPGNLDRMWRHRAAGIFDANEAVLVRDSALPFPIAVMDKPNTKLTVIVTGPMVLVTFSSRIIRDIPTGVIDPRLFPIWPDAALNTSRPPPISVIDIDDMMDRFIPGLDRPA